MNETLFRATATAVMKEANRRHGKEDVLGRKLLSTLDIDVIVSEAIKVAGKNRITDCPGPLGGFWEAVDYMGDVVLDLDLTPNLARCFSMVGVARGPTPPSVVSKRASMPWDQTGRPVVIS